LLLQQIIELPEQLAVQPEEEEPDDEVVDAQKSASGLMIVLLSQTESQEPRKNLQTGLPRP